MPYICREPTATEIGTLVDDGNGNNKGTCVSIVKYLYSGIGHFPATNAWKKGKLVKEAKTIAKGTAIATFSETDGGFSNGGDHAAVYIEKNSTGIWVWDQFLHKIKKPVGKRLLIYGSASGHVNDGNKFYIIE